MGILRAHTGTIWCIGLKRWCVLQCISDRSMQGSQYWLGSESENQKFFKELLDAAKVSR